MPLYDIPAPAYLPSFTPAECAQFDDFLTTRGWWKTRADDRGVQYWKRHDENAYFTTAEAVSYEFIRFINMGHHS